MNRLSLVTIIGLACALTTACSMKPYEPPKSGKVATVIFDGSRMPKLFPFFDRRLNVHFYDKCYKGDPYVDGVLGKLLIKEENFLTEGVAIPAGKPLFLSYGVADSCMVNFGFTPEAGEVYRAEYDSVFGGCKGLLVKTQGAPNIPGLKSYKLTSWEAAVGAGYAWRACTNIDR